MIKKNKKKNGFFILHLCSINIEAVARMCSIKYVLKSFAKFIRMRLCQSLVLKEQRAAG